MPHLSPNPFVQDRSIVLDPACDSGVIYGQSPLRHHLFQIAVAERIPEIPAHTQDDHLIPEMTSTKQRCSVLRHLIDRTRPASFRLCDTTELTYSAGGYV